MTKSSLLRVSLLSGCAAILGGAGLFTIAAARSINPDVPVAQPAVPALPAVFDAAICRSPRPTPGLAGLLRFVQVEMSPGALPAVTPAPEFTDSDPPLWDGLGSITYKITTANAQAQAYFDQGLRLYARALEENPKSTAAWTGQVRMLVELGEFREAKAWADKALETHPNHAELLASSPIYREIYESQMDSGVMNHG